MPETIPAWLDAIGAGMALAGGILAVVGSLGVLRFPDLYTRLHAASITDTGAATLMLLGLALMAGLSQETLKLVIAWAFVMLTSPTASHALANAAWSSGHKPRFGAFSILTGPKDDAGEPSQPKKRGSTPGKPSGARSDLGVFNLKAPGAPSDKGEAS